MTREFQRGDRVVITYCGRTLPGMVILASPNGDSLMLGFHGALPTRTGGTFVGTMPVLRERGVYRDLIAGDEAAIDSLHGSFVCPRCGLASYNPNDIGEGYCGRCHDWTD